MNVMNGSVCVGAFYFNSRFGVAFMRTAVVGHTHTHTQAHIHLPVTTRCTSKHGTRLYEIRMNENMGMRIRCYLPIKGSYIWRVHSAFQNRCANDINTTHNKHVDSLDFSCTHTHTPFIFIFMRLVWSAQKCRSHARTTHHPTIEMEFHF